jgi:hypothetical protein
MSSSKPGSKPLASARTGPSLSKLQKVFGQRGLAQIALAMLEQPGPRRRQGTMIV